YITAEDMNIGISDLEIVRTKTRWVTGLSRESGSSGNPSPYTARGCFLGVQAISEEVWGSKELAGKRVLIQGVGAVGGRLAIMLKEAGAKVTICDINEARVKELKAQYGFDAVPDDKHLETACDIYSPCARGATLNSETIPKLKCRAIAGAANNQLLAPEHGDDLRKRGILYGPDYVINAGGIINVGVELLPGGYREEESLRRIDRIPHNLKKVFEIAKRDSISTQLAADRLAIERIQAKKKAR
ncbi:MAG: Glu/Leu/Phe/Val dehydrogenase family protein, partial [Planctomycetota bacterium]